MTHKHTTETRQRRVFSKHEGEISIEQQGGDEADSIMATHPDLLTTPEVCVCVCFQSECVCSACVS